MKKRPRWIRRTIERFKRSVGWNGAMYLVLAILAGLVLGLGIVLSQAINELTGRMP